MKHLACIMDGNRRWARNRKFSIAAGHKQGAETINLVSQFCLDNHIPYLSLYTFSIENLRRSETEKAHLFHLINQEGKKLLPDLTKRGIRVKFIGCRSLFPTETQHIIQTLEEKTSLGNKLQINFLFCYGARQEILASVKKVINEIQKGIITEEDLTEDMFAQYLWTAGIPEPDLVIRTGGAARLSNFLLYQAAYSELYFLNCLWPDISRQELENALHYFNQCKRNFGV